MPVSAYTRKSHVQHRSRARATVGDGRKSGHRPRNGGYRQLGSIQHTAIFNGRSILLHRSKIRGHDTRGQRSIWTSSEGGASLREKFKWSSSEAIRAVHSKINNTRKRSEQDPNEYVYIMDSNRDQLNTCDQPQGPTYRQYEDIFTSSFTAVVYCSLPSPLGREEFDLADIRRMMAAIGDADNLGHSSSGSFLGIAGRVDAMQAMTRARIDIKCHILWSCRLLQQ